MRSLRYFKYDDEYSEIAGGTTYVETEDGWALRQLTINGDRYLASNINDPVWGMNLAEGQVDYDQLTDEQVTEIPEQEFEAVWDAVLATHDTVWRRSQMRYPIGRPVQGALLIFYPQGVVIQLDQETVGIADYAACRASTAPENMYPRHKVSATVAGYDERQHWIKLDLPQMHAESIN
jgi:hypothetical protein